MRSVNESALDPTRVGGVTRLPGPCRVRSRPMPDITPAMPPSFQGAPATADSKTSSPIPVPPGVGPSARQPKPLDRLRGADRNYGDVCRMTAHPEPVEG